MGKPNSWMPLYGDDFQAKTGHLTATQRGAYHDLLWAAWTRGNELPTDNEQLMRLARCTPKEWAQSKAIVLGFFQKDGEVYRHKRVGIELERAQKRYEAKAKAGAKGALTRWQTDSTANSTAITDPMATGCTTHNSHSTSVEKHPSDVLAKPRKRKSQIPHDWQPSDKDTRHATDRKLDPQTIQNLVGPFRDHHIAKQTLSADFSANWRTWVANHIHYHGTGRWPRDDAGRPKGNISGRASVSAAKREILIEAGVLRSGDDYAVQSDGRAWAEGIDHRTSGPVTIVTPSDGERGVGPSNGPKIAHEAASGADDRGYDEPTESLSETADGVSSGRGASRSEIATEFQPVVALVAGTSREVGDTHIPPQDDAGSLEIPGFLRRYN